MTENVQNILSRLIVSEHISEKGSQRDLEYGSYNTQNSFDISEEEAKVIISLIERARKEPSY